MAGKEDKERERARRRLFEPIEKNWVHNKDVPSEEIERAIEEAMREVRPGYSQEKSGGS